MLAAPGLLAAARRSKARRLGLHDIERVGKLQMLSYCETLCLLSTEAYFCRLTTSCERHYSLSYSQRPASPPDGGSVIITRKRAPVVPRPPVRDASRERVFGTPSHPPGCSVDLSAISSGHNSERYYTYVQAAYHRRPCLNKHGTGSLNGYWLRPYEPYTWP